MLQIFRKPSVQINLPVLFCVVCKYEVNSLRIALATGDSNMGDVVVSPCALQTYAGQLKDWDFLVSKSSKPVLLKTGNWLALLRSAIWSIFASTSAPHESVTDDNKLHIWKLRALWQCLFRFQLGSNNKLNTAGVHAGFCFGGGYIVATE